MGRRINFRSQHKAMVVSVGSGLAEVKTSSGRIFSATILDEAGVLQSGDRVWIRRNGTRWEVTSRRKA